MTTRRSSGVVAAIALAISAIGLGSPAVGAETPTVVVSPATVVDRQTVTVRTSGLPTAAMYEIRQCRAPSGDRPSLQDVPCRVLSAGDGIPPTRLRTTVFQQFRWSSTTVDCAVDLGGCVVGVVAMTPDGGFVEAWTPLTFAPTLTAAPLRGLTDGDVVAVTADLPAHGSWTVAQCDLEGLLTPSAAGTDAMCGAAVPLVRAGHDLVGQITVHDPLVAVDGTETICRYQGCGLVVRAANGTPRTSTYLSFGEPVLSTGWKSHFEPGEVVPATLFGLPGVSATVRQCAGMPAESTCDDGVETALDAWGWAEAPRPVHDTFVATDGSQADCGTAPCVLVAEVDGEVVVYAPIAVVAPASVTLTPASDLLEGQPMTVTATGLPPSEGFGVYRCPFPIPHDCNGMGTAWSDAAGTLTLESTAVQRVGERSHCGGGCAVVLIGNYVVGSATYTMAEGTVTAVPSTGLSDGDQVRVSGSNLLPTYVGPSYGPFPSGGWHVSQCEIDQLDAPNLGAIFTHCAPPVPVTVTGSTAEVDLTVHATMTTILGGTVDCTRANACGVGFFRLESSSVSTLWAAPIEILA
jgi:hypothetical protein